MTEDDLVCISRLDYKFKIMAELKGLVIKRSAPEVHSQPARKHVHIPEPDV